MADDTLWLDASDIGQAYVAYGLMALQLRGPAEMGLGGLEIQTDQIGLRGGAAAELPSLRITWDADHVALHCGDWSMPLDWWRRPCLILPRGGKDDDDPYIWPPFRYGMAWRPWAGRLVDLAPRLIPKQLNPALERAAGLPIAEALAVEGTGLYDWSGVDYRAGWNSQSAGFSPNAHNSIYPTTRPVFTVLAMIGLQFVPVMFAANSGLLYPVWWPEGDALRHLYHWPQAVGAAVAGSATAPDDRPELWQQFRMRDTPTYLDAPQTWVGRAEVRGHGYRFAGHASHPIELGVHGRGPWSSDFRPAFQPPEDELRLPPSKRKRKPPPDIFDDAPAEDDYTRMTGEELGAHFTHHQISLKQAAAAMGLRADYLRRLIEAADAAIPRVIELALPAIKIGDQK